jgi:thymidine phosphorylase
MDAWRRMIRAQGGDPDAPLPRAPLVEELRAEVGGPVAAVDALKVGEAAWRLGAGRARKEHPVSPGAGVVLRVVPGDSVSRGAVVAELHADDDAHMEAGRAAIAGAIGIGDAPPAVPPRVRERIAADGD